MANNRPKGSGLSGETDSVPEPSINSQHGYEINGYTRYVEESGERHSRRHDVISETRMNPLARNKNTIQRSNQNRHFLQPDPFQTSGIETTNAMPAITSTQTNNNIAVSDRFPKEITKSLANISIHQPGKRKSRQGCKTTSENSEGNASHTVIINKCKNVQIGNGNTMILSQCQSCDTSSDTNDSTDSSSDSDSDN